MCDFLLYLWERATLSFSALLAARSWAHDVISVKQTHLSGENPLETVRRRAASLPHLPFSPTPSPGQPCALPLLLAQSWSGILCFRGPESGTSPQRHQDLKVRRAGLRGEQGAEQPWPGLAYPLRKFTFSPSSNGKSLEGFKWEQLVICRWEIL